MGNRSRYVAAAGTVAAVALAARRRARRRAAAFGIGDAILPTRGVDAPSEWEFEPDPGHAPGHRHLSRHEARQANERPVGWRRSRSDQHNHARD